MDYNFDNDAKLGKQLDVYQAQDEVEASLEKVTAIIADAKESDPEFYDELKTLFNFNER